MKTTTPQGSITLPVALSVPLRRALEARAAAEDTSMAEIIRRALRRYLEVEHEQG